ncbi:hypothetical protein [Rhodococcus sp. (in: high G+C Gram-positive bacteria)]|uniref:hypothetical protein n=1 Tax=Rhodococcus sp. TaxID=1831 RepID=UPI00388F308C
MTDTAPVSSVHRNRAPDRTGDRRSRIEAVDVETASRVRHLGALARRGLAGMYSGIDFPQTMRAVRTPSGTALHPEGHSPRYTAIAALGIGRLPTDIQRHILRGGTADDLVTSVLATAHDHHDTGVLALALWAAGEVRGSADPQVLEELRRRCTSGEPMLTVDCAWALTAAVSVRDRADTDDLIVLLAERLLAAQGPGGLFPHSLSSGPRHRIRDMKQIGRHHVGSFADQVYPLQALARTAAAVGDTDALEAANATASRICAVQGSAGQWWWHYDSRTRSAARSVVERYPVYSVHQHAMAPMALFDLRECGGDDHISAVESGVDWLFTHPESSADLVCDDRNVVWRKVGRREPRKAVRSLSAVTTAARPGLVLPGLDRAFPPGPVDNECRPYELGWLLYAWHPGSDAGESDA